jgi:hypothetical protein
MNWSEITDSILKHTSETFGERVVYWPSCEPSFEIRAVFDASFQMVDAGGAMIQSTQPRLGVRLSQFSQDPREGDRVEVRGTIYDVIEFHPDGQGGANLLLHRCPSAA